MFAAAQPHWEWHQQHWKLHCLPCRQQRPARHQRKQDRGRSVGTIDRGSGSFSHCHTSRSRRSNGYSNHSSEVRARCRSRSRRRCRLLLVVVFVNNGAQNGPISITRVTSVDVEHIANSTTRTDYASSRTALFPR